MVLSLSNNVSEKTGSDQTKEMTLDISEHLDYLTQEFGSEVAKQFIGEMVVQLRQVHPGSKIDYMEGPPQQIRHIGSSHFDMNKHQQDAEQLRKAIVAIQSTKSIEELIKAVEEHQGVLKSPETLKELQEIAKDPSLRMTTSSGSTDPMLLAALQSTRACGVHDKLVALVKAQVAAETESMAKFKNDIQNAKSIQD
ncbi:MAG TPA: hypothetical protein VFF49_01585, partial [Thermodesulfobacteriota bacterium]|nr:hypothetical protein [Thermodesulfobacteriota bacterium]